MAGYPLIDWADLDALSWYELRSVDSDMVLVARFTGVLGKKSESAWFEVDGKRPSREFWKKAWTAARTQNPYS
jgi:hypothetical protein